MKHSAAILLLCALLVACRRDGVAPPPRAVRVVRGPEPIAVWAPLVATGSELRVGDAGWSVESMLESSPSRRDRTRRVLASFSLRNDGNVSTVVSLLPAALVEGAAIAGRRVSSGGTASEFHPIAAGRSVSVTMLYEIPRGALIRGFELPGLSALDVAGTLVPSVAGRATATHGAVEAQDAQPPSARAASNEITTLSWRDTATSWRGREGDSLRVRCPADGALHSVWGTDDYSDDSSVCSAAVHAGLINVRRGGEVLVDLVAGRESYRGSNRRGVESLDYGAWDAGFRVRAPD